MVLEKNLVQRLIFGLLYGVVIFLGTTIYGAQLINSLTGGSVGQYQVFYVLMFFFLSVSVYEVVRIMQFSGGIYKFLVFPLAALVFYFFSQRYFAQAFDYRFNTSELLAIFLLVIIAVTVFRFPEELRSAYGKLIFAVIYTAIPFSFALALPEFNIIENTFSWEVFLLFLLIWFSDSFAYFTGRFFGKNKMAPVISPKKTWEGFAGGVFFTLIAGLLIEIYGPDLRGNWIVVGLLVAVFGPLGDLMESQLKRTFGVKDSGKLIPGHGGILDRLDSFMLCVPVIYLYFVLQSTF